MKKESEIQNLDIQPEVSESGAEGISIYDEHVESVMPLISAIAYKRLGPNNREDAKDIIQTVSFKLWKWLKKRDDSEPLEETSWRKIANTATQNEIRTHYRRRKDNHIPIDEDRSERHTVVVEDRSVGSMVEGNTRAEYHSLIRSLWHSIQELSVRQRVSLLFFDKAFLIDIVVSGCCTMDGLAEFFELTPLEFKAVIKRLPMSDEDLMNLLREQYGISTSKRQMWNARGKAKAKLRKLVSE